jgi:hypothetical protein
VRTSHAVSFLFAPPYRHVQIVLRYARVVCRVLV